MGAKILGLQLFTPIRERVEIAQKTVKDSPADKLYDALINILCGAGGMVEVNKRVGSDEGLQRAFGRERCAEQSVIQETLDHRLPKTSSKSRQRSMRSISRIARATVMTMAISCRFWIST